MPETSAEQQTDPAQRARIPLEAGANSREEEEFRSERSGFQAAAAAAAVAVRVPLFRLQLQQLR